MTHTNDREKDIPVYEEVCWVSGAGYDVDYKLIEREGITKEEMQSLVNECLSMDKTIYWGCEWTKREGYFYEERNNEG